MHPHRVNHVWEDVNRGKEKRGLVDLLGHSSTLISLHCRFVLLRVAEVGHPRPIEGVGNSDNDDGTGESAGPYFVTANNEGRMVFQRKKVEPAHFSFDVSAGCFHGPEILFLCCSLMGSCLNSPVLIVALGSQDQRRATPSSPCSMSSLEGSTIA